MRILFLALDVRLDDRRGDCTHTMNLAAALEKRGHEVTLIVAEGRGRQEIALPGVTVHRLAANGDVSTVRRCMEIARSARIQAIYERRYSPKIAYAASRRMRVPFVVEVNGIVDAEARSLGREVGGRGARRKVKSAIRGHFFRKASAVIAVSKGIKAHLTEAYGLPDSQVRVVLNGVDPELFAPQDMTTSRRANALPEEAKIACFVGNLAPWQGVESLVRAAPKVLSSFPSGHFVIVGGGLLFDEMADLTSNLNVASAFHMPGPVPYSSVPSWISASDVCVAPFTRERLTEVVSPSGEKRSLATMSPLKVFEYMACGRPVIITDIPDVADTIRSARAGIVVPLEDPEALAEAVETLFADPEECEAMGQRGRRLALDTFTWDHTAMRVERVLEEALT